MFDEMFQKDDSTKMVNDELSCEKYKYNSCPKEIIDFLNQIYQMEIKKIDLGRSFFPASTLSDFTEKSRSNAIKQGITHFLIVIISVILFMITIISFLQNGLVLENGDPNLPMTGIFALVLMLIFFTFEHLHFYWYGQLTAMQLGTSSTQIVKATYPIFKKWYISIMAIFLFATVGILNIPNLFNGLLFGLVAHMKQHEMVWSKFLGDSYHSLLEIAQTLDPTYVAKMVFTADLLVVAMLSLSSLYAYVGFRKGRKEQLLKNIEELEIEKYKNEYVFDKALRELESF